MSQPEFPDFPMPAGVQPQQELQNLPARISASRFDLSASYPRVAVKPVRIWLHVLLLLLTLVSTCAVGARMQFNFDRSLPVFEMDRDLDAFWAWWPHPAILQSGLPFSLTLLAILLAHECGHYVACLYYGIDASLPFFLPAPTFTGTFGAFIRIRSPIYSRSQLFDIGVAGPIAGFVFLMPAVGVGLAFSKVIPGIAAMGSLHFGTPVFLRMIENLVFPGAAVTDIYLHPIARAAWVGMFATALNLLPAGQLDGGHIIYALFGKGHKWVTRSTVAVLVPIGIVFWNGWLLWAAVLFFLARRHPPIYDLSEVGAARWQLGILALTLFLLCFTLAPINQ